MKEQILRINSIDCRGSICDGPGIRSLIFFQGCSQHCPECHNPQTWSESGGILMPVSEIFNVLDLNTPSKRVTITGGEPLLQPDGLYALLDLLFEHNYDTALYTGYDIAVVPSKILLLLNHIKYGEYQKECSTSIDYFGSDNQQFITLK